MMQKGSLPRTKFIPCLFPAIFLVFLFFIFPLAQAQEGTSSIPACILKKDVYTCDGVSFQKLLANARTVSIDTQRIDKVAQSQLADFIEKKLHKTVASEGSPADLIFLLMPIQRDGVNYMMSDVDLGTLRVYLPNSQNQRGDLVWAEVYNGRHDMPWPSVITGVLDQFRSRFKIK